MCPAHCASFTGSASVSEREQPPTELSAPEFFSAEFRAFFSRVLTSHESLVRRVVEGAEEREKRADRLEAALERSIEARLEAVAEREDLLSQRHHRDLEAAAAKQRSEAFSEVTRDIRALAPLVLKKFMGVPLTGNDSHGLTDLLGSMSDEQLMHVMTTGQLQLTIGQRQLLGQTIMSLAEAEKAKQAESEKPEAPALTEKAEAAE